MYKKICLDELCKIKTNFFTNLQTLYKKQRYVFLKEFIKDCFKDGNTIYFFESNVPHFKLTKNNDKIHFFDEKEKIELELDTNGLTQIHTILKDDKKVSKIKNNLSIVDELVGDFLKGNHQLIGDKPYIIYDIETVGNINDLRSMKFVLGYSIISNDPHKENIKYKFIGEESLNKYLDFLLKFDGYIIGYNNIYFDNPVVCYNMGVPTDVLNHINSKSLDLFVFLRNLTGKRYSLDKVSKALISVGKTLESGQQATEMLSTYYQTKDPSLFSKVKSYCRNDVKMTFGVLLYLLKNQKVYLDGEYKNFNLIDMIKMGNNETIEPKKDTTDNQNSFKLEF